MSATYGSLPFDEAIAYLRSKVPMTSSRWEEFTGAMHNRAFVVAGAMKESLVKDLMAEIQKAIEGKGTIQDFRKRFDEIVDKHGWAYKGNRKWRTKTIYYTNLSTSYAAGREHQRQDPNIRKAFPHDRYRTMDDARVRPLHKSWGNVVLPVDDPWWDTHTPPNGWGCRCWKEPVSRGEFEEFSTNENFRTTAPDDGTYAWKNPATGEVRQVPNGIDPGWDYNPGKDEWPLTAKQAK